MPANPTPSVLYLASSSPRRSLLVSILGVRQVIIKPSGIDENLVGNFTPSEYATELALQKALATRSILTAKDDCGIVVGADTIVVIHNTILGKPIDPDDAVRMLKILSDNTHTVYTGIALVHSLSGESRTFVESTEVNFRAITDQEIARYVASGSPMDKSGSYGIQDDHGAVFINRIEGDYYNVVGLPLCATYLQLQDFAPSLF